MARPSAAPVPQSTTPSMPQYPVADAPIFSPNIQRVFLPAVIWEPDRIGMGASGNVNQLDAVNVWPHPDGYETIERHIAVDGASGTPASKVVTGISVPLQDSNVKTFICTSSKLHFRTAGGSYTDVTGAVTAGPWSFASY